MGKHRKPNRIQKYAAAVVPTVALASVLMSGSAWPSTVSASDVVPPPSTRITSSAPVLAVTQWHLDKPPAHIIHKVTRKKVIHKTVPYTDKVVTAAKDQLGVPYVYGGESPGRAFDCSGLTQYAYSKAGKWVPRVADDQFHFFKMIPKSRAVPGDLVFFHDNSDSESYVYHVGVYDGGDKMIVAPTEGQDVQYQNFSWGGDTVTFGTLS
jgi:cell wall-associated NlpC family hydrolase